MIVLSFDRAMTSTMNGGKSNLEAKARMAKRTTIRMVTVAGNSSMAVIRVTMVLYLVSCWAPTARVTDKTVGMAIGIPPIKSTRMSLMLCLWSPVC